MTALALILVYAAGFVVSLAAFGRRMARESLEEWPDLYPLRDNLTRRFVPDALGVLAVVAVALSWPASSLVMADYSRLRGRLPDRVRRALARRVGRPLARLIFGGRSA